MMRSNKYLILLTICFLISLGHIYHLSTPLGGETAEDNKNIIRYAGNNFTMQTRNVIFESAPAPAAPRGESAKRATTINNVGNNVTTQKESNEFNATILVHLSGEMGNQISKMAYGLMVKWKLDADHGIQSHIWLRHQDNEKWRRARKSMQTCFISTREMDFEKGNSHAKEFTIKKAMQESRYGPHAHEFSKVNLIGLDQFAKDTQAQSVSRITSSLQRNKNASSVAVESGTNSSLSLPFIQTDGFANGKHIHIQRYYHKIREFFQFDYGRSECCKPDLKPPDPDESVFHFRNFKTELPSFLQARFPELGPNQVAKDLFGHLPRGSKVAIISRFVDDNVHQHVEAFEKRGLQVRVITGNSGEQDFCFLMSAEKEIVGSSRSTFFYWAGLLGKAKTIRLHTALSVNQTVSGTSKSYYKPEELRGRFVFSNHILNEALDVGWFVDETDEEEEYYSESQDE